VRIIRAPLAEPASIQEPRAAVETVSTPDGLESLGSEWDSLVRAMPRPSPFLLHGWLLEWWRTFGDGAKLTVVTARRDGRLVGAIPAFVRRAGAIRVVRFLGGHESALADVLLAPDEPPETGRLLLEELRQQPFDYADLFGLPQASLLERSGGPRPLPRIEAPVLDMPDGWEAAYSAKTSSKKRNQHRRRLRQLGEVGPVEFVVGRTRDELEPLLEDALQLHELRWRGRPDGSTFGTERGSEFHRAALRRLADDDVLRIVLMRVDGKPAAFHYFFALDGVMIVHRLGFDPALSRFSPGLVATLETLRTAGEEGLKRVEFLGGNERYKVELADRLEPLSQAIGLPRTPLGAVASRQRVGLIELRKTLKRSTRLQRLYLNGLAPVRSFVRRSPHEAERDVE
jgi:CelD/BcsL family acetyltransferase involved in cellulose biosynthesis